MNTFTIYQNNIKIFSRCCDSPPSLEEKNIILFTLQRHRFTNLNYIIDVIQRDRHRKLQGVFHNADKFIQHLEDLCKEGIKYGVELYLD